MPKYTPEWLFEQQISMILISFILIIKYLSYMAWLIIMIKYSVFLLILKIVTVNELTLNEMTCGTWHIELLAVNITSHIFCLFNTVCKMHGNVLDITYCYYQQFSDEKKRHLVHDIWNYLLLT